MTSTSAVLEQALGPIAALTANLQTSLQMATDDEVGETLREIEELGRLVDVARVITAAEVDERSRRDLGTDGMAYKLGCSLPVHLIERVTLVAQAEGSRRLRLGTAIRPRVALNGEILDPEFPAVAEAFIAGKLGVDSARLIVRYLGDARRSTQPDQLAAAEVFAVDFAFTNSANLVEDMLIGLLQRLDPDGTEPRDEDARRQRSITLGREKNGVTPIRGSLDPTSAGLVKAAFAEGTNPKAQPRFLPEDELADAETAQIIDEDGTVHTTVIDPRTREQRQHDILIGTLTAGLRNADKKSTTLRPLTTVMVTVTLDDLEKGKGAGWIDDVTAPVAATTVEQLVCDGGATPIVLGKSGEVLYLGTPSHAARVGVLYEDDRRQAPAPGTSLAGSWTDLATRGSHPVTTPHLGTRVRAFTEATVRVCPSRRPGPVLGKVVSRPVFERCHPA
ncbi:HNH endonuclease signature motif containing protein [soil metagenome]